MSASRRNPLMQMLLVYAFFYAILNASTRGQSFPSILTLNETNLGPTTPSQTNFFQTESQVAPVSGQSLIAQGLTPSPVCSLNPNFPVTQRREKKKSKPRSTYRQTNRKEDAFDLHPQLPRFETKDENRDEKKAERKRGGGPGGPGDDHDDHGGPSAPSKDKSASGDPSSTPKQKSESPASSSRAASIFDGIRVPGMQAGARPPIGVIPIDQLHQFAVAATQIPDARQARQAVAAVQRDMGRAVPEVIHGLFAGHAAAPPAPAPAVVPQGPGYLSRAIGFFRSAVTVVSSPLSNCRRPAPVAPVAQPGRGFRIGE